MKAVQIKQHGSFDVLSFTDINDIDCPPNKVKVKVKFSSINHLDLWIRKGVPGLHIEFPRILGSDASGVVSEVGKDISTYNIGDDVVVQPGVFDPNCKISKTGNEHLSPSYGILGETHDGVQAEYIYLDPIHLVQMPSSVSYKEASSMGLTFMTAYEMLIKRSNIKEDDLVLIYGGASGVGSAAIQIAKDIGCRVISTCGTIDKIARVESFGADCVVLHDSNLYNNLKHHLGNKRVDVVFEHIGAKTWGTSMKILSKGGRIVTCGATTGPNVEINLAHLFFKNLSILGSTMGSLDTFNKVMQKISSGAYKPVIDKVYDASDVAAAHQYIEERKNIGKVLLEF